jgi:hypothetical protein
LLCFDVIAARVQVQLQLTTASWHCQLSWQASPQVMLHAVVLHQLFVEPVSACLHGTPCTVLRSFCGTRRAHSVVRVGVVGPASDTLANIVAEVT